MDLLEPSMAGVHFTPFRFITGHCAAARIWASRVDRSWKVGRGFLFKLRLGRRSFFGGASDD